MIPQIPAPKNLEGNEPVDKTHRKHAEEASHHLARAFPWDATAEGVEFWVAVNKRLRQIAEDGQLK